LNSKQESAISNHSAIRILVVDDFAPWCSFVIEKLRENPNLRIVDVVSDGLEAVQKAEELQPDLILLDIGLPTVTGIEAARQIRKVAPKSKILFVSEGLDGDVAHAALSEGGHGYVLKSDAYNELLAAVEAVMEGKKFVSRRLGSRTVTDDVDSQAAGQFSCEETITSPAVPLLVRRKVSRCHEVQFYPDEPSFLDGFTRFISAALKAGNAAVFVGTTAHRYTLYEKLHTESADIRAAIRVGKYVALDALEVLSNCMVNDMPEPSRFFNVADDLIVAASKWKNGDRLRVAICGECAPILWAGGKADAAIRLEELWNKIAETYDVDILCGYLRKSIHCEEDGYTFRRICEEHSAVY
jgi:DNA-binding NarL/FixJ family response regulator